jgi:uncharacterized membrane protein YgdD (TMEM256/DUF423 family)
MEQLRMPTRRFEQRRLASIVGAEAVLAQISPAMQAFAARWLESRWESASLAAETGLRYLATHAEVVA